MAKEIITLGVGGIPITLTPFMTTGLQNVFAGRGPEEPITLGIGGAPDNLTAFILTGLDLYASAPACNSVYVRADNTPYIRQDDDIYIKKPDDIYVGCS